MHAAGIEARDPEQHILLVEKDPAHLDQLAEQLQPADGPLPLISHARTLADALSRLAQESFHVVLLDLGLEPGDELDTLARVKVAAAPVPIIVLANEGEEELALRALHFGAQDYLLRGCDERLLRRTVRHAVERHRIMADLAAARRQEHFLATHDALTGLPNRLAFHDQLRRTLAYSARSQKQLAVLFLDLDRFKQINDSLGHPAGDDLLRIVSDRLQTMLRQSDMVTRLGGDEFVIMLQDIRHDYVPARVAQKITEVLTAPCSLDGQEYRVTASIGIALFPQDGRDPDVLIRNADTAMYHAKTEGPNRFSHYAEHMNGLVSSRLTLENSLREATERKAFTLHYQPQIDVAEGRIFGAEALLRWNSTGGEVPPDSFVPMAEEAGLIAEIGEWVLRRACQDARDWHRGGCPPIQVSVNVSTRQLVDPCFADTVASVLRDTGLEPGRLELEITESSVLQERGVTRDTIERLRALGTRIVIDDFGTGYSALSALKQLPVDGLKIDRSFVQDIVRGSPGATITEGLIAITRGLGLQAIAEGVESREERDFLYERGCPRMQGFLFSKPMTADELREQLAHPEPNWDRELVEP